MIKTILFRSLLLITLTLFMMSGPACDKSGDESELISDRELFMFKCTPCHETDKAVKLHGTKESSLEVINRMRKKGAEVSESEAMRIAEFLSTPNRSLFEETCSRCHELDRVFAAHKKGTLNKETIMRMKEKGAKISEEDEQKIIDYTNWFLPLGAPR